MSLITPSGGLVYHLRALRYRDALWASFRAELRLWLERALPSSESEELLLVGPSAGHCLPLDWLNGFQRLVLLEPDPLARRLLSSRLRGPSVQTEHRDYVLGPLLSGRGGLERVLEQRPRAAVLFCNMLGQLHFALSDEEQLQFQAEFGRRIVPALAGRAWASFHDRWSFDLAAGPQTPTARAFERQPSDEELAVAWFGSDGDSVTALDHGTNLLFPPELPRFYLSWQLTPSALHLIEAVAG